MADILIATTRASSNGSSLRITLPQEVAEKLKVSRKDHVGFYEVDEEIVVRKIE
jgi:bifunctional DNA-binding transcriptional regulator/antitoxin component of YhaV-PrlF toxin-antitoxin module